MKKQVFFLLVIFCCSVPKVFAQIHPVEVYGELFREVQMQDVFPDSKTFPDCIPIKKPEQILEEYNKRKDKKDFKLKEFVLQHFLLPPHYDVSFTTSPDHTMKEHINVLWKILERKPDTIKNTSLIPLPHSYIVPGGRFREIYYWDSYFTMLGLMESNEVDLAEEMVKNFAFLLDTYGKIPNGNRTYYLSRSQPPFFSLMVELLAEKKGDEVLTDYLPQLIKEYAFWMDGTKHLSNQNSYRRVVKMRDGEILNRYWDDKPEPRPESYREDVKVAANSERPKEEVYRNIRAACESGWDFSSRWLEDPKDLSTIRTTEIVPVDLNCLLYGLESTIARAFDAKGDSSKAALMSNIALRRKRAITKYFWNSERSFFMDYDFANKKSTGIMSLSGVYPLFFEMVSPTQAEVIQNRVWERFFSRGGLVTTTKVTDHQWDAPNGWPPLQYMTIAGLKKYNLTTLANEITNRWLDLNQRVFQKTGQVMEKYNVLNPDVKAGGGEYPAQDGFGWTNGVYLKLESRH